MSGRSGWTGRFPEAWTNGEALIFANWPVYESPYVRQAVGSGVFELNNGKETLTIDITGFLVPRGGGGAVPRHIAGV